MTDLAVDEPTFDANGYPTEATLERIRSWQLPEPREARALLDFARRSTHPTYATWFGPHEVEGGREAWTLATGGWSGNEDVVAALDGNHMFTLLCWQKSERGGLHEWRVLAAPPEDQPRDR